MNSSTGIAAPGGPEELTLSWLARSLRPAFPGAVGLTSFESEILGAQTGLTGRIARVVLRGADESLPRSIIAKFAAGPGPTRDLAQKFSLYGRESQFYQTFAARSGLPTPALYYASPPDEPFVLLIEDLVQGHEGDLTRGASLEQASRLLDLLAGMHARFWDQPELLTLPWLPAPNNAVILELSRESSVRSWEVFKAQFGEHMPHALRTLGDRLSRDRSVLDRLAAPPWTLVHGDLRANNVMFRNDRPREPLAIFDWQTAVRGRGPIDVACFFATSLSESDRRTAERELLPAYHARLLQGGVRGYSLADCRLDYRLAVANLYSQIIALNALIDVNSRIADEHALATGARLIAALLDLHAVDLVPGSAVDRYVSAAKRRLPLPLRRLGRRALGAVRDAGQSIRARPGRARSRH